MTTDPADPADPACDRPLDPVDALVQLSFLVQGVLSAIGSEHDLSIIQIRLLGILRDRRAGMVELATYLGLDKSSMTGLVGRAEKRGLVKRSPSPHDGRAVLVSLTPDGERLTERAGAEIARRVAGLTERLSPAERDELTRLATVLLDGTVSQAAWARRH
ncbi:MarR family winged helix-turn-helix transcriptional regulator [Actinomadura opuntiae]|uniref:MarR family winged helix-turn-helix transcriptional regulator n=1 Tax=Actinomadura sp. OS1-43 TaxID=604315 RepID=UPI00255AE70F|nr:MarR family transcriptional regulator [Actinomadura sp. OS1-43]MDL4818383.1 MarR family transcriptional regulator [Actinomadura sp. OS1-43]